MGMDRARDKSLEGNQTRAVGSGRILFGAAFVFSEQPIPTELNRYLYTHIHTHTHKLIHTTYNIDKEIIIQYYVNIIPRQYPAVYMVDHIYMYSIA